MEYPELSLTPGSGTFSMQPRAKSNSSGRKSVFAMQSVRVVKKSSSVQPETGSSPGSSPKSTDRLRRPSLSQRMMSREWTDHDGDGLKGRTARLPLLTGTDKMLYCLTSPTNPMLIQGLVFLDGEPDMAKFKTRLGVVASKQYRMRSVIMEGRWVEVKDFSVDNQLLEVELNEETGTLEQYISKLASKHIDESKPMWEMIHIKNARDAQTVLLFRLHHVIGDGMSCFFLLQEFAIEPGAHSDEPTMVHIRRAPIPWLHMLLWPLWSFVVIGQMLGIGVFQDPKHVLHPRKITDKKAAFFETSLSRARILEVANKVGIESVTTIVLTVVSGAFRRFMLHHGDKCRRDITAIVPFSTRSRRETGLKNNVATFFLRLPVSCKTIKGRLLRCRNRLDSMKKGPHVFVAIFAFWFTVTFLPRWLLIWLQEVFASRCSLILSTVPGPPTKVKFSGKELRNVYGFPPTVGKMSVCVATFEYNGQVAMGILMDDSVPEYELFAKYVTEEFSLLYEEIVGKPLTAEDPEAPPDGPAIPVITVKQAAAAATEGPSGEPPSVTPVEPL